MRHRAAGDSTPPPQGGRADRPGRIVEATVTSPTSRPTGSPIIGARFVDADELICPGCGEQVRCAPPVTECGDDGAETTTATVRAAGLGEFSHRDGRPLCRDVGGRAVEPIEAVVVVG